MTSRILAALGLVVALLAAAGGPAAAHSDLVSSDPAAGAQLAAAPTAVTLVFNEQISEVGLQVVAKGPAGSVPLGAPSVAGTDVTAAWPAVVGDPGEYQMAYRVVSADGHPIDGSVSFTIAVDSAAAPTGGSAEATPATAAEASASPVGATESGGDGTPLWVPALIVLVGVGVGAGVAYWLRSRRAST